MPTSSHSGTANSPELSLTELRVFACAARLGSLSATARALGMSQQSVSARVRSMERTAGVRVFSRSAQGVELTATGEAMLPWVSEVIDAADRLREGLAALGPQPHAHSLTVAASQTIAAHLLPEWLVTLRQRQAAMHETPTAVQLHTANSAEVVSLVRSGAIDLGFIETPELPAGLGRATVGIDPLVCAVAAEHPWAKRSEVTLAEVAATALVRREAGSGTLAAFERAVARELGTETHAPIATLSSEAAVRSAVAHAIAPSVMSALSVRDDVKLGRIVTIPFAGAAPTRPLTAIWRGEARDLLGARRHLVAIASAISGSR